MDALRNGTDLLDSAGLGDAQVDARKGHKQLRFPPQNYARLEEIADRWNDVVQTLALQPEVGEEDSTVEASGGAGIFGGVFFALVSSLREALRCCMGPLPRVDGTKNAARI